MERGSRNHSTTLLLSTKQKYRGQREKAETIQLRPYCPQNNIHKTKRESYKYSATPLLSNTNPGSIHTQTINTQENNILY